MLKRFGQTVGWLLALPARLKHAMLRRTIQADAALSVVSETLANRTGLIGNYTRQAFYRCALKHTGRDIHFGFMTVFSKRAASLGHRVYLGRFCTIGWVTIGDDAKISDGVYLLSGGRHHFAPSTEIAYEHITIGARAWIGAGAIVMADVGEGAVVGAGAVVTQPVPAGATVAGVPAKSLPPPPLRQAA